jgi:hypothetical protein
MLCTRTPPRTAGQRAARDPGGAGFVVDLGRPPVAGIVELDLELARLEDELARVAGDSVAHA